MIKSFLRSFSFRAGFVVFSIISSLLIAQHVILHFQSIKNSYEDIHSIMDAYEIEMDEAMESHNANYVKELLRRMSGDMHDKHLYLAFKDHETISGNLKYWPQIDFKNQDYAEVTIPQNSEPPLHLLISISEYNNHETLLIGYDLERIDQLRENLLESVLENLALALIASLCTSLLIVWLLSRHFRKFNTACEHIIAGNLGYRIKTTGANDEFDELAINLNRMLDWIRSLIHIVKDSSNAIAHDMRTPLSRIRLDLRALSEHHKLNHEIRHNLLTHVERVDELISMFDNILNIAKAESRSDTEIFEIINVNQLLKDVLDFYAPMLEERNLILNLALPDPPIIAKADKQLLGQALVNIIDNACKYTSENSKIEAGVLKNTNGNILIYIADSGSGIPEELRERAKERFFRLDSSRSTDGHGLGLSLVNAVAELHQGQLKLEDNSPGLRVILEIKGLT